MKQRAALNHKANRPLKASQPSIVNPRVKIVDRAIGLLDFVSRNTQNDAEQQEAVELKRILAERKQTLLAA